jgi:hypothetical protein
MSWKLRIAAITVAGLFPLTFAACEQKQTQKAPAGEKVASGGDASKENAAVPANAPGDKELIEKQKICPVTDQPLGSMGEPVKVVVKGRTVFLCCEGCTKKLMSDPDKYLKKLDEKK